MIFVVEHTDGSKQYPVNRKHLRDIFPHVSFPVNLTGYINKDLGIYPVQQTDRPADTIQFINTEGDPVRQGDQYVQTWLAPVEKPQDQLDFLWYNIEKKIKKAAMVVIEERYPDWKQRNMLMRVATLQNRSPLTEDEQAELVGISAAWDWIDAVRAESDALEQYVRTIGLSAARRYDYKNHAWPE